MLLFQINTPSNSVKRITNHCVNHFFENFILKLTYSPPVSSITTIASYVLPAFCEYSPFTSTRPSFRSVVAIVAVNSFFLEAKKRLSRHNAKRQSRLLQGKPFAPSSTALPHRGHTPMDFRSTANNTPPSGTGWLLATSSRTISDISRMKATGAISPRSICRSFCSHSAVSCGDCSSSGRTVMSETPLGGGAACSPSCRLFAPPAPPSLAFQ